MSRRRLADRCSIKDYSHVTNYVRGSLRNSTNSSLQVLNLSIIYKGDRENVNVVLDGNFEGGQDLDIEEIVVFNGKPKDLVAVTWDRGTLTKDISVVDRVTINIEEGDYIYTPYSPSLTNYKEKSFERERRRELKRGK
ncbi:hypothetical protein HPP92_023581 [Vanilla planifolia]|uniref:Uncharacterized protein n=1 Tax=Vanilla planifolia TaxID=51239 RepID=A0A835PR45_VANPL|nr:hypothetical protein HPP92_023847 [Vanilla planifolia]KAG0455793.1 hypothetical protein HPP92_023581 [Vanilla planifolia]